MRNLGRDNLKQDDSHEPQLIINQLPIPPGGEWSPQWPGWFVIHVSSGVGYLLHPRTNWELVPGGGVLLSDQAQGCVRASEVSELRLQFFRVEPRKLTGLLSLADQTLLQHAASDEKTSLRVFPPDAQFSDKFRKLSSENVRRSFPARVQMLQLFIEVFGASFQHPPAVVTEVFDARQRLKQMLSQTPLSDLIELGFSKLVSRTRCSPRHTSRLFSELVGVSFREKQTELRLTRACELLATTHSKVVDVAMESGFQSTSLFSAIFKQRLGISPAKWREQAQRRRHPKPTGDLRLVA